jgi:hypothetical protein
MTRRSIATVAALGVIVAASPGAQSPRPATARPDGEAVVDVTVSEGTSMSVSVSPDGRTLAADPQGSIWTMLPAADP